MIALPGCATHRPSEAHTYPHAAVAADHPLASQAGVEILRQGGNAVDAAVATSFTLSVVRPQSCGVGGGGFMVIYLKDHPTLPTPTVTAINYRETAPAAAGPDYYETKGPDASTKGGAAVAIPGTVAGLLYAQEKYGLLDRAAVLAPAIRAAREGFLADEDFVEAARSEGDWIAETPARQDLFSFVWRRYARENQVKIGDRILNPEQARLLHAIARDGRDAFYTGPVAEAIVSAVNEAGGDLTLDDLAGYAPREVRPLRAAYRNHTFFCMPPPSSGGLAMLQVLGILDHIDRSGSIPEHNSADYIHRLTECFKYAFADRARYLADPAFTEIPIERLLSKPILDTAATLFDPVSTHPPEAYGTPAAPPAPPGAISLGQLPEDSGTSHFCVIDEEGNAVACTETVNLFFGSLVGVNEYGFVLNDEMDDFLTRRGVPNAFGLTQADANLPAPGKRPLSSMSPTIVLSGTDLDDAEVAVIAGASGGPRIITGTLQAILNVLFFDMSAEEAVESPRFHHQWMPNVLGLEPALARNDGLVDELHERGHTTERRAGVGVVQLIRRTSEHGKSAWQAHSDSRKGGEPAGY